MILFLVLMICAPVTLTAAVSCGINTAGFSFGTVDVLSRQPRDSNGSITVTCTGSPGEAANYTLTASMTGYGSSTRFMRNGDSSLRYNLFTDISRSRTFGDGSDGSSVLGGQISLAASQSQVVHPIYGRIEANQNTAPPGTYTDNVVITISY